MKSISKIFKSTVGGFLSCADEETVIAHFTHSHSYWMPALLDWP